MSEKTLEPTFDFVPQGLLAPPQAAGELGRLAQYRILRLIERGGMGIVFLAEDTQLRRSVALKVIRPEFAEQDDSRVRFLREARAIAALKHDNVVTIYHVGEERGAPFLVMELLQGKSLKAWLESGRRPTVAETVTIGRQVAKALVAAHGAGLIHRDLKPGNLWLEAPSGRVKLLDFGLVRSTNPQATMAGEHSLVGTPIFMSPEQARGDSVDPRSDLFSLGSVLYVLATGHLPFEGPNLAVIFSAIESYVPAPAHLVNPEIPPALGELIAQLMSKAVANRPGSAKDVLEALTVIQRNLPRGAAKGTIVEPAVLDKSRRLRWVPSLVAAAVVVFSIVLIGVAVMLPGKQDAPEITESSPTSETVQETDKSFPPPDTVPVLPAPTGPIDLLALADTKQDVFRGVWLADGNRLVGQGRKGEPRFAFVLPWEPPAEYLLRLKVTRLAGAQEGQLGLGLSSQDAQFTLVIDADRNDKHFTGLLLIGGRPIHKRSDGRRGKVLHLGLARELAITVRRDQVSLAVDGEPYYQWKGDLKSSARETSQADELLRIGGTFPAVFRFEEIWLEPLGEDRGRPVEPK